MKQIRQLYQEATALGVCSMFAGTEDEARILRVFCSVQGLEFCKKHSWPSLKQMRSFDKDKAAQSGIYLDAGNIALHNPRRVILIGDTQAQLTYDDQAEVKHNVVVMHGATANIEASNWAVVFAESNVGGGQIKVKKDSNSIVDVR